MRAFVLLSFLSVLFFSCEKEEEIVPVQKDFSHFLLQTTPTFKGILDGTGISWKFGAGTGFYSQQGYKNGNGICDPTDPERVVEYGLISNDGQKRLLIQSPKYNSASNEELEEVFSVGKKKLGDEYTDFHLSIKLTDTHYYSSGSVPESTLEILKTEEFVNEHSEESVRVWFVLDAEMVNCECEQKGEHPKLTNGLIIAEFIYCKQEKQ